MCFYDWYWNSYFVGKMGYYFTYHSSIAHEKSMVYWNWWYWVKIGGIISKLLWLPTKKYPPPDIRCWTSTSIWLSLQHKHLIQLSYIMLTFQLETVAKLVFCLILWVTELGNINQKSILCESSQIIRVERQSFHVWKLILSHRLSLYSVSQLNCQLPCLQSQTWHKL